VYRMPFTGSETVLDAIAQIKGLPSAASRCRIWVERGEARGEGPRQVVRVDRIEITRDGLTRANYELRPGDRLFVKSLSK